MTRVDFYVLQSADAATRLQVAMRLTQKAFSQGHRVFINAADEAQAHTLDEQLWSFRPESFLPHGLHGAQHSEGIAIGWGQEPAGHSDLLVNLRLDVPAFFSRFERVAEVVTQDADSLAALRSSYRFYRERGYELNKHDL
ncbi:MAG: DNA polymerase III subunit chi [Halioglobus sp.]|nr:DNA polymerase III subunit chi [Halioglobus sp.]